MKIQDLKSSLTNNASLQNVNNILMFIEQLPNETKKQPLLSLVFLVALKLLIYNFKVVVETAYCEKNLHFFLTNKDQLLKYYKEINKITNTIPEFFKKDLKITKGIIRMLSFYINLDRAEKQIQYDIQYLDELKRRQLEEPGVYTSRNDIYKESLTRLIDIFNQLFELVNKNYLMYSFFYNGKFARLNALLDRYKYVEEKFMKKYILFIDKEDQKKEELTDLLYNFGFFSTQSEQAMIFWREIETKLKAIAKNVHGLRQKVEKSFDLKSNKALLMLFNSEKSPPQINIASELIPGITDYLKFSVMDDNSPILSLLPTMRA